MSDERIDPADKQHEGWTYFVEEMRGKQYGAAETLDAWLWFKAGFGAGQTWAGY